MSEKRFILNSYENSLVQEIMDTESDFRFSYEKYCIDTSLVDLLNSIQEENRQLRKRVEKLQSILHIVECCDINE